MSEYRAFCVSDDDFGIPAIADQVVADFRLQPTDAGSFPKIDAIKEYRCRYDEAHGFRPSLIEAKNAIEAAIDRAGF